jgi:hypothetical protein
MSLIHGSSLAAVRATPLMLGRNMTESHRKRELSKAITS